MSEINTGGPAFPFEGGTNNGYSPDPGMTLRDWFAGQALSSMAARRIDYGSPDDVANAAYTIADAMVKAREVAK